MSNALRILIDQDAVIADWGAGFDRPLERYGDDAAGIPRSAEQPVWDLNQDRTPREREIIAEVMTEPGFYGQLDPIPGAHDALHWLVDSGHDVRIVSSPYITNPTCASDKMNWIVEHYGTEWADRLILTTDKTVVRGDVLIDDKPTITGSAHPEWRHIIFGHYAYNKAVARPRLTHWDRKEVALTIWEAVVHA